MAPLRRLKRRFVAATVSACLICSSCAGHWPLRLPPRETWVAVPTPSVPFGLSFESIAKTATKTQQQDMIAAWALITPETAAEWFHVGAVQRGIQPLVLILHNGGVDPYWFDPASINPQPISPDRAAQRLSSTHPLVTAERYLKWLTLLPLSLFFVSIVEPATGLEFPTMEEVIQRPTRSDPRNLQAQLMGYELPAVSIGPEETRAGLFFIHPPALDDQLSVRLVNKRTQEPLVLNWNAQSTPLVHSYDTAYETVWNAAVKAATAVPSWSVVSSDGIQGRIVVRRRSLLEPLGGGKPPSITITVVSVSPFQTQVILVDRPPQHHALWFMTSSQKSNAFFDNLTTQVKLNAPSPAPAHT